MSSGKNRKPDATQRSDWQATPQASKTRLKEEIKTVHAAGNISPWFACKQVAERRGVAAYFLHSMMASYFYPKGHGKQNVGKLPPTGASTLEQLTVRVTSLVNQLTAAHAELTEYEKRETANYETSMRRVQEAKALIGSTLLSSAAPISEAVL